jgi:hypothetical protein
MYPNLPDAQVAFVAFRVFPASKERRAVRPKVTRQIPCQIFSDPEVAIPQCCEAKADETSRPDTVSRFDVEHAVSAD